MKQDERRGEVRRKMGRSNAGDGVDIASVSESVLASCEYREKAGFPRLLYGTSGSAGRRATRRFLKRRWCDRPRQTVAMSAKSSGTRWSAEEFCSHEPVETQSAVRRVILPVYGREKGAEWFSESVFKSGRG